MTFTLTGRPVKCETTVLGIGCGNYFVFVLPRTPTVSDAPQGVVIRRWLRHRSDWASLAGLAIHWCRGGRNDLYVAPTTRFAVGIRHQLVESGLLWRERESRLLLGSDLFRE